MQDKPATTTAKDETMPATDTPFDASASSHEDKAPATAPTTAPAQAQSQEVAHHAGAALAASGEGRFASMDGKLGFGAFPQVKLDKDKFVVGEEGEIDSFDFKCLGSQSRWIYKRNKDEFFFTYDNVTATDGRMVQEILNEWKSEGEPMKERREYQEVYGYIMSGEHAERMVVLSIPPSSIPRLAGLRAELQAIRHLDLDTVIIRIEKGAKIRTKSGETYYPWKFSFCAKADEYTPE